MKLFLALLSLGLATVLAEDGACYSHVTDKCEAPGDDWTSATCNSVHGGFKGNSDNLHRIIVDDFTDSMNYLLMASHFSTDKVNRMGFSKFFMEKSDAMWSKGKDMMKYVLKRGGKMGSGFQLPPIVESNQRVGDYDYSNEMKGLGVTLDLLKDRASDIITAYKHSLSSSKSEDTPSPFDPATAHLLEELSEDYTGEINGVAKKLNTLGKMVRKANSNAMALHLFDNMLK
eukprot:GFUD01021895.1.p1 GENE.GFUD01021895.1~~GFUD01021895.1.p1  ORF type:complete len:245 (+),score=67.61 GFUD01021895.1:47-736(+)